MNSLNIDITNACNIACEFCRVIPGDTFLTYKAAIALINKHSKAKIIGIGGGEPTLHPRLPDILREIIRQKKIVALSTNLVDHIDKLAEFYTTPRNQFTLQISLPTHEKQLYEKITKRNALDQVLTNLNIVKPHFNTLIHTVVYQENLSTVESLIEYSVENLGTPIRINLAYPTCYAKDLNILTPKQTLELTQIISEKRIEYNAKRVISDLRFTDSTCTKVNYNCPLYANLFGIKSGICKEKERTYYDIKGNQKRCELMEG